MENASARQRARTQGLSDSLNRSTVSIMSDRILPDDDLIGLAKDGDVAAFGTLVDRHQTLVRGWLRVRLTDWATADDLAQDVFVTAFRRVRTYSGEAPFAGWLIGIARNHWRNYVRKHQAEAIGGSEELATLIDQSDLLIAHDESHLVDALRVCLEALGSSARDILEQRYVLGRTVRELSATSGRGYSALTMQLHRLREVLAECIRERIVTPKSPS
jgi:RNA polymerase sigma-70 factor, ECF subfamily